MARLASGDFPVKPAVPKAGPPYLSERALELDRQPCPVCGLEDCVWRIARVGPTRDLNAMARAWQQSGRALPECADPPPSGRGTQEQADAARARPVPAMTIEQGVEILKSAYGRKGATNMAKKKAAPKKSAKSARSKRDGVERARYTKRLPVPVGSKRVAELADAMVVVIRERDAVQEQQRERNAAFRKKLASYDERFKELATSVEKRVDFVDVECVEKLVVETNEIQVIRADTGEVVETRTAEGADRQEALFGKANPTLKDLGKDGADEIPADMLEDGEGEGLE